MHLCCTVFWELFKAVCIHRVFLRGTRLYVVRLQHVYHRSAAERFPPMYLLYLYLQLVCVDIYYCMSGFAVIRSFKDTVSGC